MDLSETSKSQALKDILIELKGCLVDVSFDYLEPDEYQNDYFNLDKAYEVTYYNYHHNHDKISNCKITPEELENYNKNVSGMNISCG